MYRDRLALPGHVDEVRHDVVLITAIYLPETRAKRQLRRRILRDALQKNDASSFTQTRTNVLKVTCFLCNSLFTCTETDTVMGVYPRGNPPGIPWQQLYHAAISHCTEMGRDLCR